MLFFLGGGCFVWGRLQCLKPLMAWDRNLTSATWTYLGSGIFWSCHDLWDWSSLQDVAENVECISSLSLLVSLSPDFLIICEDLIISESRQHRGRHYLHMFHCCCLVLFLELVLVDTYFTRRFYSFILAFSTSDRIVEVLLSDLLFICCHHSYALWF